MAVTLIELKAAAYDCAIQVKAWQDKLNEYTNQINNYKEPETVKSIKK